MLLCFILMREICSLVVAAMLTNTDDSQKTRSDP